MNNLFLNIVGLEAENLGDLGTDHWLTQDGPHKIKLFPDQTFHLIIIQDYKIIITLSINSVLDIYKS